MADKRLLKPAAGLLVRHPDGTPLRPEGEMIEVGSFWQRRIDDGDVVEAKEEPAEEPSRNDKGKR